MLINWFFIQRSDHPSHFSATSPKDSWVFLCVRFHQNAPKMEAIVNADFHSKVSRNDFPFDNVKITTLVIGANQDSDKNLLTTHPFEGKISSLNIWEGEVDDWHMEQWYRDGNKNYQPTIKWAVFAKPANRFGNVHFVSISSAERGE